MTVPYYSDIDIKSKADDFRLKYWGKDIPIDIEMVAEKELGIKIIPIPNLIRLASVDALITSKWDIVFTDDFYYSERENRFRFSLAHELGHYVLHKEVYEAFGIKNIDDYNKFFNDMTQENYSLFESQANRFANYLLIPADILCEEIKNIINGNEEYKIFKKVENKINYLAYSLCDKFKVNETPMEIAIKKSIDRGDIEL
ncbi:MAG: ImmA/IrrE family metallo-endopeptidase [Candidatus Paceibacterota bacterium]